MWSAANLKVLLLQQHLCYFYISRNPWSHDLWTRHSSIFRSIPSWIFHCSGCSRVSVSNVLGRWSELSNWQEIKLANLQSGATSLSSVVFSTHCWMCHRGHIGLPKAASNTIFRKSICGKLELKRMGKKASLQSLPCMKARKMFVCFCELMLSSDKICPPYVTQRSSFLKLGIQEEHLILFGCMSRKSSWISNKNCAFSVQRDTNQSVSVKELFQKEP